jgi:hypothetical protein
MLTGQVTIPPDLNSSIGNSGSALPFETLRSAANSYGFASGSRGSGGRGGHSRGPGRPGNVQCQV